MAKDGSLSFNTILGRMCETLREPITVLKNLSDLSLQFTKRGYTSKRKSKINKMRLDAMKRQGHRTDLTSSPLAIKSKGKQSLEIVGEATGDSKDTVHRYIRFTELIPPLIDMVDTKKLALRPAVELSYLPINHQQTLFDVIQSEEQVPSQKHAVQIRKLSEEQNFLKAKIKIILNESEIVRDKQFKIPKEKINKFFPAGTSAQNIEETIIKALELWHKSSNE